MFLAGNKDEYIYKNNIMLEERKETLTRKDVAELLHVTKQTVINYTKSGLLRSYKMGRRVLYLKDEVLAVIKEQQVYRYKHCS
jgi:excisionase family DNA binding protein